jgi:hypothetical protein
MAIKPSGSRYTPKQADRKGPGDDRGSAVRQPGYATSGRYTAPTPKELTHPVTKPWVPYVMFVLLLGGLLMILLNYLGVLPSAPTNWYLLGGLLGITGGFATATQLR